MKLFNVLALMVVGVATALSLRALSGNPGSIGKVGKIGTNPGHIQQGLELRPSAGDQMAAFSAGCFWGTENTFRKVKGVVATAVGYTGGTVDHPTYEQVCTHRTGHAETVLVEFNPKIVSYSQLLNILWKSHDPTTPNQEGPNVGTNYRSAVWTTSPEQDKIARNSILARQKLEKARIVTTVAPLGKFWLAEDYHQQYDEKTGTESCPFPAGR